MLLVGRNEALGRVFGSGCTSFCGPWEELAGWIAQVYQLQFAKSDKDTGVVVSGAVFGAEFQSAAMVIPLLV